MCGNIIKLDKNLVAEKQCIVCGKKIFVPIENKGNIVICNDCKKIKEGA